MFLPIGKPLNTCTEKHLHDIFKAAPQISRRPTWTSAHYGCVAVDKRNSLCVFRQTKERIFKPLPAGKDQKGARSNTRSHLHGLCEITALSRPKEYLHLWYTWEGSFKNLWGKKCRQKPKNTVLRAIKFRKHDITAVGGKSRIWQLHIV